MRCLTSARFNLVATLLSQGEYGSAITSTSFVGRQNPVTLEIDRDWTPDTDKVTAGTQQIDFPLIARGIVDGGIRVVGTTERINPDGAFVSEDYVRIQYPTNIEISKRDRIYNIRNPKTGVAIWKEEEFDGEPTVFEVLGVTPILDPLGQHVENQALLQRAEVQSIG